MNKNEKLVYARALAETFSAEELKEKRKKLLQDGINGKVTSWSDIGLSSSVAYDFTIIDAVDMLTTALDMQSGNFQAKKERIRRFVI